MNEARGRLGLRLVERHELSEVSALSLALWSQSYVPDVLTSEEAAYFWEQSYSHDAMERDAGEGALYYWVEVGGERIGFCSIRMDLLKAKARLGKLYLQPAHQGQGLAGEIIDRLKINCKEAGCASIWLYVFRKNQRAIKAYRKAGFEVVALEKVDAGAGFFYDDVVMSSGITLSFPGIS